MKSLLFTLVFSSIFFANAQTSKGLEESINFVDLQERVELDEFPITATANGILPVSGKLRFGRMESKNSPSRVVHVVLETNDGVILDQKFLEVKNGVFKGHLELPKGLLPGMKILAYTQWMKNYGRDFYASKALLKSPSNYEEQHFQIESPFITAESGALIDGIENRVVVHLPNSMDNQNLKLVDGQGNILKSLVAYEQNLAMFSFVPSAAASYSIRNENGEKFDLPEVQKSGWVLAANNLNTDYIAMEITARNIQDNHKLIGVVNGKQVLSHDLSIIEKNYFNLPKTSLNGQELHLAVIDEDNNIVAHRPVFLENRKTIMKGEGLSAPYELNINRLIKSNKLDIKGEVLAVAITSGSQSIQTTPVGLEASSRKALWSEDLQFLVAEHLHNKKIETADISYKFPFQQSFQLVGRVYDFEDQLLKNTEIQILGSNKRGAIVEVVETDENGILTLDGLWFRGELDLVFRTEGEKTAQRLVRLEPIVDFVETKSPEISREMKKERIYGPTPWLTLEDEKLIDLEEVTVTESKKVNYGFTALGKTVNEFRIKYQNKEQPKMLDELLLGIPGVQVRGLGSIDPEVIIQRASGVVLWVIDGIPLQQDRGGGFGVASSNGLREVMNLLPANTIERVEVLVGPAETGIYGVRGSGGVIQVFTRFAEEPSMASRKLGGLKLQGLSAPIDLNNKKELKKIDDTQDLLLWSTSIADLGEIKIPRKLRDNTLLLHLYNDNGDWTTHKLEIR